MAELAEGARLESGYTGNRIRGSNPLLSASIKFAVLDGELAVPCNLQSAIAGSKTYIEVSVSRVCRLKVALTIGSCATGACEPCQVREEAALSDVYPCAAR